MGFEKKSGKGALVDPVVVVRAEEEHGEVTQVVLEALDVQRHRPGVADLSRPPSESGGWRVALRFTRLAGAEIGRAHLNSSHTLASRMPSSA